jgi:circadian clock protein KaiB
MKKSTSSARKRPRAPARKRKPAGTHAAGKPERYLFQLFVTGTTPRSTQAIANIRALCEEHLDGRYDLEVIDLYQQPALAAVGQVIASPTLVKQLPKPLMRMVGNLSNREHLLFKLNLPSEGTPAAFLPSPPLP